MSHGDIDDDGDQAGVPLFEDLSDSPAPPSAKRKRGAADSEGKSKAAKRPKKTKKPKDIDDSALDTDLGVNLALARMDGSLMADHIAQRTRRFLPDLSLVEVEDLRIPAKSITDTTAFLQPRVAAQLPEFLEQFAGAGTKKKNRKLLSDAPAQKGAPHTIVIAGAGLRAADLTRELRRFQTKEALVAKLFAKHIKIAEAVEMLKGSRVNIGVGTPQRVIDLLENGALSSGHLERIVVDASHIDQKRRGILDMKETQVPLMQLLTRQALRDRYDGGGGDGKKIELLFF